MIRLGVSLPVLMQLLGHKDIRMTMASVVHWRRLAISWKCIVVSSMTIKPAASYNASTSASSQSFLNSINLPSPKNEERLAGQGEPIVPDFVILIALLVYDARVFTGINGPNRRRS